MRPVSTDRKQPLDAAVRKAEAEYLGQERRPFPRTQDSDSPRSATEVTAPGDSGRDSLPRGGPRRAHAAHRAGLRLLGRGLS